MSSRSWLVILLIVFASSAAISSRYLGTPAESTPSPATTSSTTTTTTVALPSTTTTVVGAASTGCLTGADHEPARQLVVVPGTSEPTEGLLLTRYIIEVEEGLAINADCFADLVASVLHDERSWAGSESLSFERVDSGVADLRVTLASPATTDAQCAPMDTDGMFSCWDGERAMLNVWRWEHGTPEFKGDLTTYRTYLINHEVGHGLGHNHRNCQGEGEVAPVMQQQTVGLDGCLPNGWPLADEY